MRVLHIIPTFGGGGAERQLSYFVEEMCRRGVDVHVAMVDGGPHLARVVGAGAAVHRLAGSGNHDPRLLLQLARVVRKVRPNVMQTWLTQADVLGGAVALTHSIPWVLTECAAPEAYAHGWKNALRRSLGRFAQVIIANSQVGISYWMGVRARKYVVPNAVDVAAIDAAVPAVLDVAHGQRVVLYAGRLAHQKNIETLVPALCDVARTRDAIVVVCGAGSKEQEMRAELERQGCSDRFRILGYQESVWQFMKRADVLVSVSWWEGQPNAVIEGAAALCPLVLSDIPQHRAFLSDRSALFAPPGDAAAIADAVRNVLDDPHAARERARRARAAVEGWSIGSITGDYLKIYDTLR